MAQQLLIALDPALGVEAEGLMARWNGDARLAELGVMGKTAVLPPHFHHDTATILLLTTAISVASQVVASQLYDLIKSKTSKQPEVIEIEQPDGSKIIIIKRG